jgi:uncharacterized protein
LQRGVGRANFEPPAASLIFPMATDLIRYDLLVQDALRSVVRKVLADTARGGLIGEHHFNIAFKTQAPGVVVPAAVKSRFPDEMSIILQHEFWDLVVTPDAFEVNLNFSRRPERLTVPFDAITGFTDPSVPFGFKLEPRQAEEAAQPAPRRAPPGPRRPDPSTAQPSVPAKTPPVKSPEPMGAKASELAAKASAAPPEAKVVSIDAFRKK